MEVQDVDFRTVPMRLQDPGVMTLVFIVSDVGATLARAKAANADVVTPGGEPVALADGSRAVLIRDLDGRPIELREPAIPPEAPVNGLAAMRLSIAVADMTETLDVYRDVLGFTVEDDRKLGPDAPLRALTGLATAEFRRSVVQGPGGSLTIEFVDYQGVDREPVDMRIQDRGAARLQLRSENLESLVGKMRAAGLQVVSAGGGAVPIPPNFLGALVEDPNNFFLTPFAPCDGCAPRLLREAMTGADFFLWMLSSWHDDPAGLYRRFPKLGRLADVIGERPAVAKVVQLNQG